MAKSGRKSLKAALHSQQAKFKKHEKAAKAAQESAQLPAVKKKKRLSRKTIVPFNANDKILLIGEGNFSFATALFKHRSLKGLSSANVTATAYDSKEECLAKYPDSEAHINDLVEKGVQVLFNVDAIALEKCKPLKKKQWDRIVWNFPHAGKGISDQDRNILSNQKLLLGFFRSATRFLTTGQVPNVHKTKRKPVEGSEDEESGVDSDGYDDEEEAAMFEDKSRRRGTILVTLRNVSPYTDWDLPRLAKKPPPPTGSAAPNPEYIQLRSFAFSRAEWPGYDHRMTKGERVHGTGKGGEDRTWEFCLKN